jgi:hypothetical protein
MFDFIGKMSAMASPELIAMVETLPQKVAEWSAFLAKLDKALKALDSRGETLDNKIEYLVSASAEISQKLTLLMSESAVTPELHDDVLTMATADPRNERSLMFGAGEPIQ